MPNNRVTISDIAREAGVGIATVSNVLNDRGGYSDATRDKVLAYADALGYVVNYAAKALREARSYTVGIITPDVSNPFYSTIIQRMETDLYDRGYATYICDTGGYLERSVLLAKGLIERQVDGIAFVGRGATLPKNLLHGIPVANVACGEIEASENVFNIDNDTGAMVIDGLALLAQRGCANVLTIGPYAWYHNEARDALSDWFREKYAMVGLPWGDSSCLFAEGEGTDFDLVRDLVADVIIRGETPDGIFTIGDRQALGAIDALVGAGLVPGKDVLVLGYEDAFFCRMTIPHLSSIDRNPDKIAEASVKALVGKIEGEDGNQTIRIPHRIVERETTLGHTR